MQLDGDGCDRYGHTGRGASGTRVTMESSKSAYHQILVGRGYSINEGGEGKNHSSLWESDVLIQGRDVVHHTPVR